MKQTIFLLIACMVSMLLVAQSQDGEPCCAVINIDKANGIVSVKNIVTRQIFQFKVDAAGIGGVRLGDSVSVFPNGYAMIESHADVFYGQPRVAYPLMHSSAGRPRSDSLTNQKWIMGTTATKAVTGKLSGTVPPGAVVSITVYSDGEAIKTVRSFPIQLAPGNYTIMVNNIRVDNVPIAKGRDTRLKIGYIAFRTDASWAIEDAKGAENYVASMGGKTIVAVPVGSYVVTVSGSKMQQTIKDGQTVEF